MEWYGLTSGLSFLLINNYEDADTRGGTGAGAQADAQAAENDPTAGYGGASGWGAGDEEFGGAYSEAVQRALRDRLNPTPPGINMVSTNLPGVNPNTGMVDNIPSEADTENFKSTIDDIMKTTPDMNFGQKLVTSVISGVASFFDPLVGIGVREGITAFVNNYNTINSLEKAIDEFSKVTGYDRREVSDAINSQPVTTVKGEEKTVADMTGQDWTDAEGSNANPETWTAMVQTGQPQTAGGNVGQGDAGFDAKFGYYNSQMNDLDQILNLANLTFGLSDDEKKLINDLGASYTEALMENLDYKYEPVVKDAIAEYTNRGLVGPINEGDMASTAQYGLAEIEKNRLRELGSGLREIEQDKWKTTLDLTTKGQDRAVEWGGKYLDYSADMAKVGAINLQTQATADSAAGRLAQGYADMNLTEDAWRDANWYKFAGGLMGEIWT